MCADRCRGSRSQLLSLRLGLFTTHGLKAASEYNGLAGPGGLSGEVDIGARRNLGEEVVDDEAIVRFMKEIRNRSGNNRPDARNCRQAVTTVARDGRPHQRLDRAKVS